MDERPSPKDDQITEVFILIQQICVCNVFSSGGGSVTIRVNRAAYQL